MEVTPGRARFTEDEDYAPLRRPHGHEFNNISDAMVFSSTTPLVGNEAYGRTTSPTKLSPFAKEFVPSRADGINSGIAGQEYFEQQQQQQQRFAQSYNQQTFPQQQPYQQPSRQSSRQSYMTNGYQQNHHHQLQQQQQQQQQQQHNHYHQQNHTQVTQHMSQQQHTLNYQQQIPSLTRSVQERLHINKNPNTPAVNNYFQQNHAQHQHQQQPHQQQHQYHSRNNKSNQYQKINYPSTSAAAAATSSNSINNAIDNGGCSGSGNGSADVEQVALQYLRTVIRCLNDNPGQFDQTATQFLTIFDGLENNNFVMSNAMEDIFQESIENPNFRYMGAKLYNLLHMINLKKDSLFQSLLKYKLDYHRTEIMQFMRNQPQKVRETALFLAELYMQLRCDDTRMQLIAENIVYSLKQLLTKETTDNVRCICLTLKLAGYDLTADCPNEMQEIIQELEAINVQNPGKYPLAANVISLQKNNWGRQPISNSLCDLADIQPPQPLRLSDEPIFYGPDGRELTAEEAEFLHGGGAAGGTQSSDEDDNGDDILDYDPDIIADEETELAYKEFCKLNSSKNT